MERKTYKQEKIELSAYLDGIAGKVMLTYLDKLEFIEHMNVTQDGNLVDMYSVLAAVLEDELKFPYRLIEFTGILTIDGEQVQCDHAWEIVKLV